MSDDDAKTEARRLGFRQRLWLLACGLLWIAWAALFLVTFVQGESTVKLLPVLALALGTGIYGTDLLVQAASQREQEREQKHAIAPHGTCTIECLLRARMRAP